MLSIYHVYRLRDWEGDCLAASSSFMLFSLFLCLLCSDGKLHANSTKSCNRERLKLNKT